MIILAENGFPLQYEKVFLGEINGVALCKRASNDPHVLIYFLNKIEEDTWGVLNKRMSLFWLEDHLKVIKEAMDWVAVNCEPHPNGGGFRFKQEV